MNSGTEVHVSVIVPIRNEAAFIERCITTILDNDYPAAHTEVLVVDGMSDDGTREIVSAMAERDGRVRMLDNPRRIAPTAMNIGIAAARGHTIIRVDGHAEVSPDFLRRNLEVMEEHPDAWCVGGAVETINETVVGRAIAGAMSSPVGVGNAMFRLGNYEGYVSDIAFGAYRRWVFDRIGMFDEQLVRNQDDELNLRLRLGGGRIYMSRSIRSLYYSRATLRRLAKQYYQYGFWRIRTIQKHRQPATFRQIMPLLFVLVWFVLMVSSLIWSTMGWCLGTFAVFYFIGLCAGAIDVWRRLGLRPALLSPVVFAILHFGYGLGSLAGIWTFVVRRGKGVSRPEDYQMSR